MLEPEVCLNLVFCGDPRYYAKGGDTVPIKVADEAFHAAMDAVTAARPPNEAVNIVIDRHWHNWNAGIYSGGNQNRWSITVDAEPTVCLADAMAAARDWAETPGPERKLSGKALDNYVLDKWHALCARVTGLLIMGESAAGAVVDKWRAEQAEKAKRQILTPGEVAWGVLKMLASAAWQGDQPYGTYIRGSNTYTGPMVEVHPILANKEYGLISAEALPDRNKDAIVLTMRDKSEYLLTVTKRR